MRRVFLLVLVTGCAGAAPTTRPVWDPAGKIREEIGVVTISPGNLMMKQGYLGDAMPGSMEREPIPAGAVKKNVGTNIEHYVMPVGSGTVVSGDVVAATVKGEIVPMPK